MSEPTPLVFTYRNWRGEVSERRVRPLGIVFDATEWHPLPQWLLFAYDLDKSAERYFAMRDMGPPGMINMQEAANGAAYALRELSLWPGRLEMPKDLRTALGRASHCLDAAIAGRPKPDFGDGT